MAVEAAAAVRVAAAERASRSLPRAAEAGDHLRHVRREGDDHRDDPVLAPAERISVRIDRNIPVSERTTKQLDYCITGTVRRTVVNIHTQREVDNNLQ